MKDTVEDNGLEKKQIIEKKARGQGTGPRLFFSFVILVALLILTRLLLPVIADFNNSLTETQIQSGYVAAMQGMFLLLWLFAGAVLAVLLSQGVPVAPLIWIVNSLHISYSYDGYWYAAGDSLMFFSNQLNVLLMLLVPPVIGVAWWWAARQLAYWKRLAGFARKLQPLFVWYFLMLVAVVANWFLWHWSPAFSSGNWPNPLPWVALVPGVLLLVSYALNNPWRATLVFWIGLMLPVVVQVISHGVYDGLLLGFVLLLPTVGHGFPALWAELFLLAATPLLLALIVNQAWLWWNDRPLLELY